MILKEFYNEHPDIDVSFEDEYTFRLACEDGNLDVAKIDKLIEERLTARDEKKWPIVKWRELAHRFSDLGYAVKLPWGSDAEQQQAEKIATGIARVEVLPRMALGELRLRLERAGLVIGVDTGITHLAAAHYLPMVALFFATPAWRFAPRFNPHAISLGDVGREPAVGEVFEAATRLLRGNKL